MDWYYVKAGQRMGPVDVPALKELISKGELTQTDLVWNQTLGRDWAKISAMAELQAQPEPVAPKAEPLPKPVEPEPKPEPKAEIKTEPKTEAKPASTRPKSEPVQDAVTDDPGPKKSIFAAPASTTAAPKKAETKSSGLGSAGGKGVGLKKREAEAPAAGEVVAAAGKPEPSKPAPVAAVVTEPEPAHATPPSGTSGSKLHVKKSEPEPTKVPEPVKDVAAAPRAKAPSLISAALAQQKQVVEPVVDPAAAAPEGGSSIRSSLAALNKNVSRPADEPVTEASILMAPAKNVIPPLQHPIVSDDSAATLTADEIVRQGRESGASDKDIMASLLAQGVSTRDAKNALKASPAAPMHAPLPASEAEGDSKVFGLVVGILVVVLLLSVGFLGYLLWQRM